MISILIVNHDGRDHLQHCLKRLAGQRGSYGEIVVVDNASTDGSADMVRDSFPGCRLLALEENLGFGTANNRAAAEARGDRLLLLNSDAWLEDGALAALDAALDAEPRLALAAPRLLYPDGRLQFAWAPETGVAGEAIQMLRNRFESSRWAHRVPPRWLWPLWGPGWYSAACVLMRREAFEQVRGFDEGIFMYFEDVDLCVRLRHAGWRLGSVDSAVAYHVKGGSRPSGRGEVEYRRAQLYYYRKHRPAWENRYLRSRMRGKFSRWPDAELRPALQELLREP
ncbi:MAG: glycosyltransferase family 2 protein [bacterium]|nr:glycosyltransferase family 2 protein [bacterium]